MKVRKILFINRRLSVGGAERVMTLLANATAKRGIETDMVVLQDMERTYQVDEKSILYNLNTKSITLS